MRLAWKFIIIQSTQMVESNKEMECECNNQIQGEGIEWAPIQVQFVAVSWYEGRLANII